MLFIGVSATVAVMTKNIAITLVALVVFSSPALARTWTQAASGRKIEADFIKTADGKAHLKMANGKVAQVPITDLSKEDQEFIASQKEAAPAASSGSANWPIFRGANLDGISPDTGLVSSFSSGGPKQLWVYKDAGMGYSSFSIVDGKLFTSGTRGEDAMVICINIEDGAEVWATKFADDDQQGYSAKWGHGPRSTPTISDGLVFILGPKGTLACLSAEDGKKKWSKHLVDDFGGKAGGWGFSASPLVDGDNLVIAPGGDDAGIVCLDKKTGKVIWKADEVKPGKAEYATIVPAEINGTRQYIRLFEKALVSVSADKGKLLWSSPWGGKTAVIPTPIVDGNQIYISSGYGVGCKLVEVGSDNSVKDIWQNKAMQNHHGGVVKVGDYLYGFSGKGLICQDWKTGETVWNEKTKTLSKGAVHVADGKIFALNERDGTLTLAEASSKGFESKGSFQLSPQSEERSPSGAIWSHPVVIGGKLYLRDQQYIACYDVKK